MSPEQMKPIVAALEQTIKHLLLGGIFLGTTYKGTTNSRRGKIFHNKKTIRKQILMILMTKSHGRNHKIQFIAVP